MPLLTLSILPAPTFCPVKTVSALPNEKIGIITILSIRITIVLVAITSEPKLLTNGCMTINDRAIMTWVAPVGNPSFNICITYSFLGIK